MGPRPAYGKADPVGLPEIKNRPDFIVPVPKGF